MNIPRGFKNSHSSVQNSLVGESIKTSFWFILLITLLIPPLTAQDSSSAILNNFIISTTEIDVTENSDTVSVFIDISHSSGIGYIYLSFGSPSGNHYCIIRGNDLENFNEGATAYSGTGNTILTRGVEPGIWRLNNFRISETNWPYHTTYFDSTFLDSLGFTSTFNVLSNEDSLPPVINTFSISPPIVDVTNGAAEIAAVVEISDNISGLDRIMAAFKSPSETDIVEISFPYYFGINLTYVDTIPIEIQQYVESGEWKLDYIYVKDIIGNDKYYYPVDLDSLGLVNSFIVISENDSIAPIITSLTIDPIYVEPSGEDFTITATVTISDDLSGINTAYLTLHAPSRNWGGRTSVIYFDPPAGDTFFSDTSSRIIPHYYNTGEHRVSVTLTDMDNNERTYEYNDLVALGFDAGFSYGYGGPVFHIAPNGEDENGSGSSDSPFASINRAFQSTQDGDTIMLADGIYTGPGNRGIYLPTKYFKQNVITSENGPESTIIDCENVDRAFYLDAHYDRKTVINGLTIQNGQPQGGDGGGIFLYSFNACPVISNMIVKNCSADRGGGIYLRYLGRGHGLEEAPLFLDCVIEGNSADELGGGIYVSDSQDINGYAPVFVNCSIINNTAGEDGGGLYFSQVRPYLFNSLIASNSADRGGGIFSHGTIYMNVTNRTFLQLQNCTLVSNVSPSGSAIYGTRSSNTLHNSIIWNNQLGGDYFYVSYSDVQGGWSGEYNLNSNPLFVNPDSMDYSLQATSPCRDAGNPIVLYNDNDGSRNDLGISGGSRIHGSYYAYEFEETGFSGEGNDFRETEWRISNFQATPIQVSSASFSSDHFSTAIRQFPVIIKPFSSDTFSICFQPQSAGEWEDSLAVEIAALGTAFIRFSGRGLSGSTLFGSVNGTFSKSGSPYLVINDINISENDSLFIEPGAILKFSPDVRFTIDGYLSAVGTKEDSIIFTICDNAAAGEMWRGVRFMGAADSTVLEFCNFEYSRTKTSGFGYTYEFYGGAVYIASTAMTVSNCTFSNNLAMHGAGLAVWGLSKTAIIRDCRFENNSGDGIACRVSTALIENCQLVNNSNNGIYMYGGAPVIKQVTVSGTDGRGIYVEASSPQLEDVIIQPVVHIN